MRLNVVLRWAAPTTALVMSSWLGLGAGGVGPALQGAEAGPSLATEVVPASNVFIKLIREVDVPARDTGTLVELVVAPGEIVEQGQLLAKLDDREHVLKLEEARIELAQAELAAEDESELRYAREAQRVAENDLQRAEAAVQRAQRSYTLSQLEHYRLEAVRTRIDCERAERKLRERQIERERVRLRVDLAAAALARRTVAAPFAGLVVDVDPQCDEWVEAGSRVVRMIRLDRVRAEGLIDVGELRPELLGATATVEVFAAGATGNGASGVATAAGGDPRPVRQQRSGRVVFIDRELNSYSQQARVWVELDNADQCFRPGEPAAMRIHPNRESTGGAGRRPSPRAEFNGVAPR